MWTPSGQVLNYTIDPVEEIPEDTWFHLATVGTGTGIELYLNGEPVDSYGASDFPFNVGGGGVFDATGNQFTGIIDEVAVWHTALTAAQIATHFEAALAETDPLAPLDDGTLTGPQERADYVHNVLGTWVGDSNLDGEFSSADFVQVFSAGEYEDDLEGNSTWVTGDWNGDNEFNSSDFVTAFTDGGYEQGPRAATAAVPEPNSLMLILCGSLLLVWRRG